MGCGRPLKYLLSIINLNFRVGSSVGIGSGGNLQHSDSNSKLKTANILIRPLSRKDIFYSRSIYNVDDSSEQNEKVKIKLVKAN